MNRIYRAAVECGYLRDTPPLVSARDLGYLPREEVLLLCTGSQGEQRAALWRIARDEHPDVTLEPGDAVIFSSRVIPGNEVSIFELENHLVRQGIRVLADDAYHTHVSGHPARDELVRMYQWVRPQIAIPVHGEPRHLVEHAKLARECQVPQSILADNGSLIRLAPGPAVIVDQVHAGRLALDGTRLVSLASPVLRTRRRVIFNGAAVVVLVLDHKGSLKGRPRLVLQGVADADQEAATIDQAIDAVTAAVKSLSDKARRDDEKLSEAARQAVRRSFSRAIGKKPVTEVQVVRLA